MSLKVEILNTGHRAGVTSYKRAKGYVRRGRAHWVVVGESIRFNTECPQHQSVLSAAEVAQRISRTGYDRNVGSDSCRREELKHIPFVGEIDRLMTKQGQRSTPRPHYRNGPVIQIYPVVLLEAR